MDKNKKNKIIGLSIGILVVLIIVVSSTYAYWQITRTQETPNDIVAACLNLELDDASTENTGINLDSAWPISDEEAQNLTGYTFTVTNNCNEEINYIVGLNRVEESTANYLLDSSIKLQLDDNSPFLYSELKDVEYADSTNTEYTARASKQVSVESISANGTNTHTIRVWVSSDAPVTEQSKIFLGQVFITGGQGIEVPECFAIADNGTITGYNYECGTNVKVPAEINGIQVRTINQSSFVRANVQVYMLYNEETDVEKYIYYYTGETGAEDFINFAKQEFCEDPTTCTLGDIEETAGVIIVVSEEEYNAIDWDDYELSGYTIAGPELGYFNSETGEMEDASLQVTSLDLSDAIYLEIIEDNIFYENKVLETLLLPKDGVLTNIESFAFYGTQLEEVSIPSSVTTIGESAFGHHYSDKYYDEGHKLLTSVTFEDSLENPSQLQTIGVRAFDYNKLTEISIPSSVVSIEEEAFSQNDLVTLKFEDSEDRPSKLTNIGEETFKINNLTKVIIPSSVVTVGKLAFSENENLTEIIIKRTEEDAIANMTLSDQWNWIGNSSDTAVPVTYNPNYTE